MFHFNQFWLLRHKQNVKGMLHWIPGLCVAADMNVNFTLCPKDRYQISWGVSNEAVGEIYVGVLLMATMLITEKKKWRRFPVIFQLHFHMGKGNWERRKQFWHFLLQEINYPLGSGKIADLYDFLWHGSDLGPRTYI